MTFSNTSISAIQCVILFFLMLLRSGTHYSQMFRSLTHRKEAVTPGPRGKPQKKNVSIHCERETLSGKPVVPDRCAGTHQMMSVHDGLTHTRDPAHCRFSRNCGRQEFQNTADIILAAPRGNGREWEGIRGRGAEARGAGREKGFHIYFVFYWKHMRIPFCSHLGLYE